MKKITLFFILSILFTVSFHAQESSTDDFSDYSEDDSPKERKNAIGISGGTGYGFDYSRKLGDKVFVTLGYNALSYIVEDFEAELSGEELLVDSEIDFSNVELKLDFHPFRNAFKLVVGAAYFSSSNINVGASFSESVFVEDIEFTSDDIGSLDIDFNWGEFAPYVGIGFGRAVSRKGLGFSFNAGTYYTESPSITLVATNILEQTSDQEGLLNESFESFQFIPYLTFRLSYSF
jgi:hypothetical protein